MALAEVEKWLAPALAYDPDERTETAVADAV
jgi:hypothetical protein